MKAILGSALGGLAAGTLALVASAQGRSAPAPIHGRCRRQARRAR